MVNTTAAASFEAAVTILLGGKYYIVLFRIADAFKTATCTLYKRRQVVVHISLDFMRKTLKNTACCGIIFK
jgi:hypothetical protein